MFSFLKIKYSKLIIYFFVVLLYCIAILSIRPVEEPTPEVLFYINSLPLSYWIMSLIIMCILLYKNKNDKKVIGFDLLIITLAIIAVEWTPNLLMNNPWYVESYGRLARTQALVEKGNRILMGEEAESPAFLFYGAILILISSLQPFIFVKFHEFIVILSIIIFCSAIGKELNLKRSQYFLIPLLFFSIMWMNEFHFSRQSLLCLLYPLTIYLFCKMIKCKNLSSLITFYCLIPFFIISHPAFVPLIILPLMIYTFLNTRARKINIKSLENNKVILVSLTILISWLSWHILLFYVESDVIYVVYKIFNIVYNSLLLDMRNPFVEELLEKKRWSEIYNIIMTIRNIVTFTIIIFTFILSIIGLFALKKQKIAKDVLYLILLSSNLSNLIVTFLFFYGRHIIGRGYVFLSFSWSYSLVFFINFISKLFSSKYHQIFYKCFVIFNLFLLLFGIPILKYSPIPFLAPTKKEILVISFIDENSPPEAEYFITEHNTPHYLFKNNAHFIEFEYFLRYYFKKSSLPFHVKGIIIDYRLLIRDNFIIYIQDFPSSQSYHDFFDALLINYTLQYSIIYLSDYYYLCYHF